MDKCFANRNSAKLGAEVGFLVGLTFLVVGDPNTNLLAILK
jgi:hypothetical protein